MIGTVQKREGWQHTCKSFLPHEHGGTEMKLRRIVPLALAAYAGWKKLSPQRKASLKRKITGDSSGQPRAVAHETPTS